MLVRECQLSGTSVLNLVLAFWSLWEQVLPFLQKCKHFPMSFLPPTYNVVKGRTLAKQSTNHNKTDVNALVLERSIILGFLGVLR